MVITSALQYIGIIGIADATRPAISKPILDLPARRGGSYAESHRQAHGGYRHYERARWGMGRRSACRVALRHRLHPGEETGARWDRLEQGDRCGAGRRAGKSPAHTHRFLHTLVNVV